MSSKLSKLNDLIKVNLKIYYFNIFFKSTWILIRSHADPSSRLDYTRLTLILFNLKSDLSQRLSQRTN